MRNALLLLIALVLTGSAFAREIAVTEDNLVEVEIATIGIASNGAPVVLLREPGARRVVPIFIGITEAQAIARALRGLSPPRPMTHELLADVLLGLDATLLRVFIDEIRNNTYLGALEIELAADGKRRLIDSRPSDAMALALRLGASIHVAPAILDASSTIDYEPLEDEVVTAAGITVSRLSAAVREALALPDKPGVLVTRVTGTAEKKGMKPAALILSVNDEVPESPIRFLELIRDTPEGKPAIVVYWQDGKTHQIELGTDVPEPARPRQRFRIPAPMQQSWNERSEFQQTLNEENLVRRSVHATVLT